MRYKCYSYVLISKNSCIFAISKLCITMKRVFATMMTVVAFATGCDGQNASVQRMSADKFKEAIASPEVILIDVRTAKEYAQGHIENAINWDVQQSNFANNADKLPKESQVAVYCRSGKRSQMAATLLAQKGFMVMELATGINGWTAANLPTTTEEVDLVVTPKGSLAYFYCIKHGSVKMRLGEKWVYIDPVTDKCPPLTDYTGMPKADYILITHNHPDHLDMAAVQQLRQKGTRIVCNEESASQFSDRVQTMKNGKQLKTKDFTLTAVAAYNTSADKQMFHPKGRDNGYVIEFDGLRIYVAGDTEVTPEMGELGTIDVAFLPCNLPFTMTPDQCAEAAKVVNPKVLFPYHYGDTKIDQLAKLLANSDIDIRIRQYQ